MDLARRAPAHPPPAATPVPVLVDRLLRQRQEHGAQVIARVVLTACAISTPFVVGIVFHLDRNLGLSLLTITGGAALFEAGVLLLLRRGAYGPWLDVVSTLLEVSVPSLISLVDLNRVGPAYALTSAPVMLYALAVLVGALRLRPFLALFAGALGAAEYAALYFFMRSGLSPEWVERLPSLSASNVLQRAAYVLLSGIVGFFVCRSLHGLSRDFSAQLVAREHAEKESQALQEQLHHAQKMEAIGQLAGGIAHDFNNLLTVIIGHAQIVSKEAQDPDIRADGQGIHRAASRAAALTAQLLAFSRKQTYSPQPFDVNALVAQMRGMLTPMLGVDVKLSIEPGREALWALADPARIRAGPGQPGGQRPRRDAAGRRAHPGDVRGGAGPRVGERPGRRHRGAVGDRHRGGDVPRGAGAPVRAVLHHQGARQGHRAGARHRLRHRRAVRRTHHRALRAGEGQHLPAAAAALRARPRGRAGRRRGGQGQAAASWTTEG
ncbi:MAG: histidine kinase dimerization/phospho-acceptor domain-containing protein [Myxococcales bacterium]